MTVFGALRVKNEQAWILNVVRAMLPLCERIWVFDDSSSDGTPEICEHIDPCVTVIRSPYTTLNESRDKSYILDKLFECVPARHRHGDIKSPFFGIFLDGDEVLQDGGAEIIRAEIENPNVHAYKLNVKYLWGSNTTVRVDGVYRSFARPSIFRLMNSSFKFQSTPWGNGANFHCSSIPQELLHHAHVQSKAVLWHLGYRDVEDRKRKFEWYSKIDPANDGEGRYLHCVQGDPGGPPASAKLKWAGPLELETIPSPF